METNTASITTAVKYEVEHGLSYSAFNVDLGYSKDQLCSWNSVSPNILALLYPANNRAVLTTPICKYDRYEQVDYKQASYEL